MLRLSGLGFGSLALSYLLHAEGAAGAEPPAGEARPAARRPRAGACPARARAVIQPTQNGGPSQMDLFDPKPGLQKRGGQAFGENVETFQKGSTPTLLPSPFRFHRRGQCGVELSEVL